MKNQLLLLVFSVFLLISCDSENSDLELETQSIETFEVDQVFFAGEVSQSKNAKASIDLIGCGVTGPNCASPNQTLTYTYAGSTNITWTVDSGSISISNGQGTNTVSLSFGSDFTGGYVTAINSESPSCTVILEILKCGIIESDPICGIDINGIYELNLFEDENVAFYVVTDTSSEWTITGTFFTVTYQDGNSSYHVGYTNNYGYQQIIIPVSCSNKVREVEANVYGIDSSNVNCSDTKIRDWGSIGVCGTGSFN